MHNSNLIEVGLAAHFARFPEATPSIHFILADDLNAGTTTQPLGTRSDQLPGKNRIADTT